MDTLIAKNLDGEILDVLFSVPKINLHHQNTNYTETTSMKMIVLLHPYYTDEKTIQIRSSHNVSKAVSQPEFAP